MPEFRLSKLARLDLMDISDYTVDAWGEKQANRYLDSLENCFKRLAQTPEIGRSCESIRPGYRRIEHEKHVVFYRADRDGVFISRIFHQRMLPSAHLLEDS